MNIYYHKILMQLIKKLILFY